MRPRVLLDELASTPELGGFGEAEDTYGAAGRNGILRAAKFLEASGIAAFPGVTEGHEVTGPTRRRVGLAFPGAGLEALFEEDLNGGLLLAVHWNALVFLATGSQARVNRLSIAGFSLNAADACGFDDEAVQFGVDGVGGVGSVVEAVAVAAGGDELESGQRGEFLLEGCRAETRHAGEVTKVRLARRVLEEQAEDLRPGFGKETGELDHCSQLVDDCS